MLSKSCEGCPIRFLGSCETRYKNVKVGQFVYCPSGEKHLVDEAPISEEIHPSPEAHVC